MICPLCTSIDCETVLYYKEYPLYIKPVSPEDSNKVPLKPLEICMCDKCGFIFQNINFDPSEISKIYEVIYNSYHSPALSGIGVSLAEDFLEFLKKTIEPSNMHVLEIGCYDGYFLMMLRDEYSCKVVGCDPSPGSEIAQKFNIEVIKDYFSPELFEEKFDMIVLRCVLEHISEPVAFLEMAEEVLKPEGCIAVEVPNVNYSLSNGVIGDFFHEHMNYFTKNSLVQCFANVGFKVRELSGDGYYLQGVFNKSNTEGTSVLNDDVKKEIAKNIVLFKKYTVILHSATDGLRKIVNKISDKQLYIYGGGGHTIGLLSKTNDFLNPVGVIDGDPAKEGKIIPGFGIPVYSKSVLENIDKKNCAVIVSSKIFQDEIVSELDQEINEGLTVITLYPSDKILNRRLSHIMVDFL